MRGAPGLHEVVDVGDEPGKQIRPGGGLAFERDLERGHAVGTQRGDGEDELSLVAAHGACLARRAPAGGQHVERTAVRSCGMDLVEPLARREAEPRELVAGEGEELVRRRCFRVFGRGGHQGCHAVCLEGEIGGGFGVDGGRGVEAPVVELPFKAGLPFKVGAERSAVERSPVRLLRHRACRPVAHGRGGERSSAVSFRHRASSAVTVEGVFPSCGFVHCRCDHLSLLFLRCPHYRRRIECAPQGREGERGGTCTHAVRSCGLSSLRTPPMPLQCILDMI